MSPPLFITRRATPHGLVTAMVCVGSVSAALAQPADANRSRVQVPGVSIAASAVEAAPENPYAAVVAVEDESDKSRDRGLRLALIEVLKRVVGRSDLATSGILSRASSLVQQYAFVRDEAGATIRFRAAFDPSAVDAALRADGLPVFGVDPDLVEAWITEVHGLRDAADYARVLQHFDRIRGVRRVDVDGLHDSSLRLRVVVEGGTEPAARMAEAGGLLRAEGNGNYVLAR